MTDNLNGSPKTNNTDAGNGSQRICRVGDVHPSPSPDPSRSPNAMRHALVMIPMLLALLGCEATRVQDAVSASKLAEARRLLAQLPSRESINSDTATALKIREQQSPASRDVEVVRRSATHRTMFRSLMTQIEVGRDILDYPGLITYCYDEIRFVGSGRDRHYRIRVGTGVPDIGEGRSSSEFHIDFSFSGEILRVAPVDYNL